MSDPYGFPEDLRRLISARTNTNNTLSEPPPCVYGGGHGGVNAPPPFFPPPNSYDPMMVGDHVFLPRGFTHQYLHHHDYSTSTVNPTNSSTTVAAAASDHAAATATVTTSALFCSSIDTAATAADKGWLGFDSGNNRWPRQETLSLLEIRSRLDSKFRENNHKAPLWNEISRYKYINIFSTCVWMYREL